MVTQPSTSPPAQFRCSWSGRSACRILLAQPQPLRAITVHGANQAALLCILASAAEHFLTKVLPLFAAFAIGDLQLDECLLHGLNVYCENRRSIAAEVQRCAMFGACRPKGGSEHRQ
jgi:hypothetical protein